MILSDIKRFTESLQYIQERVDQINTLPNGPFKTELLEDYSRDLERDQSNLDHWTNELELFDGTNVTDIPTRLMTKLDQTKIQHALKNLVETFGQDAVIKANQSMKLTRRQSKTLKKAA
jgi:hypothetical protein